VFAAGDARRGPEPGGLTFTRDARAGRECDQVFDGADGICLEAIRLKEMILRDEDGIELSHPSSRLLPVEGRRRARKELSISKVAAYAASGNSISLTEWGKPTKWQEPV